MIIFRWERRNFYNSVLGHGCRQPWNHGCRQPWNHGCRQPWNHGCGQLWNFVLPLCGCVLRGLMCAICVNIVQIRSGDCCKLLTATPPGCNPPSPLALPSQFPNHPAQTLPPPLPILLSPDPNLPPSTSPLSTFFSTWPHLPSPPPPFSYLPLHLTSSSSLPNLIFLST